MPEQEGALHVEARRVSRATVPLWQPPDRGVSPWHATPGYKSMGPFNLAQNDSFLAGMRNAPDLEPEHDRVPRRWIRGADGETP